MGLRLDFGAFSASLPDDAIGVGKGFERHFRDVHVLTQHASKNVQRYEDVGKIMYGLPQEWFVLNL